MYSKVNNLKYYSKVIWLYDCLLRYKFILSLFQLTRNRSFASSDLASATSIIPSPLGRVSASLKDQPMSRVMRGTYDVGPNSFSDAHDRSASLTVFSIKYEKDSGH